MEKDFFEDIAYGRAKRKVKEIKSFYYNLLCYCIVIPILITINLIYMPEFHWFWFSAAGWGSGVIIQGLLVFGYMPFLGRDWEDRKIKQLMEKDKN